MSDNIVSLVQPTEATPCDEVLQQAIDAKLTEVVIVGYDGEGMGYYNASMTDAPTAVYHLQRAIYKLNRMIDRMMEDA